MTTNYAGYGLSEPQLHAILDFINATVTGGGASTLAALTDIASFNLPGTNTPLANALTVVTPLTPLVVTAGFTFAKATHANRRIDYNSAAAANLTFDGTAAYTTDDGNRLMQCGAGALTLLASGVTFANPRGLSLTTKGIGTYIDVEWDATIGQLTVTSVGSATIGGIMSAVGLPLVGYPDTGFYQSGAYQMSYATGGGETTRFDSGGNIRLIGLGCGLAIRESANLGRMGVATLVAGTVVVPSTNVTAITRIFVTSQVDGGTPGFLRNSARTAGTSFTILSSSATDTSTVAYVLFEPA